MPEKPTNRAAERLAWARRTLDMPDLELASASSDASFRSYWRTVGPQPALIIMDAPPGEEDVRPWLAIGRRLAQAGIHVPRVHAEDAGRGFVLIEDFGRRLYLDELADDTADALYAEAMDALLAIQSGVDGTTLPAYDGDFLHRELALLRPWFLESHLGWAGTPARRAVLEKAFGVIVDDILTQPRCFVHRDFHSRNLMLTRHRRPGVIDFQGALYGPLTYDLVSLLRDCYIAWDATRVDTWREGYRHRLVEAGLLDAGVDAERFRRWFDLAGLQRHLKVLGIFCRLALRDGKPGYLADLPRVLGYVLDVAARYPELADLAHLLGEATRGRRIDRPSSSRTPDDTACAP